MRDVITNFQFCCSVTVLVIFIICADLRLRRIVGEDCGVSI